MVIYVSRELALGKLKVPSYTPYIAPNIAEAPWPAQSAERRASMAQWNSNCQAAKAAQPQPVPVNERALYQLRFLFASDICGARNSFGGIAAQLNHLSIVLHLATTEAVGTALTYDQMLKSHLEELARARVDDTAGDNDFLELLPNETIGLSCMPRNSVTNLRKMNANNLLRRRKSWLRKRKRTKRCPANLLGGPQEGLPRKTSCRAKRRSRQTRSLALAPSESLAQPFAQIQEARSLTGAQTEASDTPLALTRSSLFWGRW